MIVKNVTISWVGSVVAVASACRKRDYESGNIYSHLTTNANVRIDVIRLRIHNLVDKLSFYTLSLKTGY